MTSALFRNRLRISSALVSLIVHMTGLLVLALWVHESLNRSAGTSFELGAAQEQNELGADALRMSGDDLHFEGVSESVAGDGIAIPNISVSEQSESELPSVDSRAAGSGDSTSSLLLRDTGIPSGGGFEGRTAERRRQFAGRGSGTPESERAVELGLAWLAAHQRPDGGWRLDLTQTPCNGQCRHSGTVETSTGATGLALLPFLGAGYLPDDPKYGDTVRRGLYYLTSRGIATPHGLDLQEGTMYAHGIATIALCEAHAMTTDRDLGIVAQSAVDFICHHQHPQGGWRYYPGQPGDTTVYGWQLMALKSAQLGHLRVPSPTIELARQFLDSVQTESGSFYGYQTAVREPSPTAIGLLSRMYYGWRVGDSRLLRGVDFLARRGPSQTDMYFNYYATNVLHHFGGSHWYEWNSKMRDYLISTQARNGHENGSWFFVDKHGSVGGRLYTTAMCIMILEVYYRHMPLYGDDSIEGF